MNSQESGSPNGPSDAGRGTLVVGGLAAVLASTCCLGPLVLLMLGVSGAWIGTLRQLEPYRPVFIGLAIVALLVASRKVFRPSAACAPGEICAIPAVRTSYKWLFWTVVVLVGVALVYPFLAPLFY